MSKAHHSTRHMRKRMAQRGINRGMVELALAHGRPENDRYVLDRKGALSRVEELQEELRLLKKVVDKGGLVVVADGAALLTTYNFDSRRHWGQA